MSATKVMFDANVVIDLLTDREPFAEQARQVFTLCTDHDIEGMLSAGEMTTIFYILRKHVGKEDALRHLRTLYEYWTTADVNGADINLALNDGMPDFEDAVLAHSSKRAKADYIITRNLKDFSSSPVPAISPSDFIKRF